MFPCQAVVSSPVGGEFLTDCLLKSLESKGIKVLLTITLILYPYFVLHGDPFCNPSSVANSFINGIIKFSLKKMSIFYCEVYNC